jgi:hypothetical protein
MAGIYFWLIMFVLGDLVVYDGICGVIDFIGSNYITIKFPSCDKTQKYCTHVRMLIYSSEYKSVITPNQSEK